MIELFYIVVFFLFFAVLAAGYFYLQRAKARDAAKEGAPDTAAATAAPAATEPAASEPAVATASEAPAADAGTDSPAT